MTTLLAIATSIAEETGFEPAPTAIVGNTDETARRLLRAIQRGGEMTARRHDWSILQTEYTFSTVASQESYALPDGFRHLLVGSAWNRNEYWEMRGSLGAREWQIRKSAYGQRVGLRDRFRINAGDNSKTMRIDPLPGGAEDLVVEYVTRNWIAGLTKSAFTADTDEPDLDAWLVELGGLWLFRRAIGEPYADERNDWMMECDRAFTRDAPPADVNLISDPITLDSGAVFANVPTTGYGV